MEFNCVVLDFGVSLVVVIWIVSSSYLQVGYAGLGVAVCRELFRCVGFCCCSLCCLLVYCDCWLICCVCGCFFGVILFALP